MFFILSKTVAFLFMPLTLITGALVISFFMGNPAWKKKLRLVGLVLLVLCSNPYLTNTILKWWEIGPTALQKVPASNRIGIVLTGVTKKRKLPRDRVYFHEGADRVTHAIQLYKLGKINKILISGGSANIFNTEIKEAQQLVEVFLMCGVSKQDLIIEDQSRNTRESAMAISKIVNEQFPDSKYLLITSAFHMRRSVACFNKIGLSVVPFSTDFKTSDEPPTIASFLVPSPNALAKWHILIRELLGMAAYKLAGYI